MSNKEILLGLLIAVFLALILSPFASQMPDGLEKVAEDKGFIGKSEVKPIISSPVPDYAWPGLKNEILATSIAGLFGTCLIFGIGLAVARLIKGKA